MYRRLGCMWMLFLCLCDVLHLVRCLHTQLPQECQTPTHCYTLYRTDGGGKTWQEASQYCHTLGQRLAVIPGDVTQAIMRRFTSPSTWVWVGGKRSNDTRWRGVDGDYYNGQIRDNSDILWCTTMMIQPNAHEYNGIQATFCSGNERHQAICELPVPLPNCGRDTHTVNVSGICHQVSDATFKSWNDARQHCINQYNGTLAYRHMKSANKLRGNFPVNTTFWMGIWRRPWSWITFQGIEHAMAYTSWVPEAGVDRSKLCLAIDLTRNSSWIDKNCAGTSQYFMCEGNPTTTTASSETTATANESSSTPTTNPITQDISSIVYEMTTDIVTPDVRSRVISFTTSNSNATSAASGGGGGIPPQTFYIVGGCIGGVILIILIIIVALCIARNKPRETKNTTIRSGMGNKPDTGSIDVHSLANNNGQKDQEAMRNSSGGEDVGLIYHETRPNMPTGVENKSGVIYEDADRRNPSSDSQSTPDPLYDETEQGKVPLKECLTQDSEYDETGPSNVPPEKYPSPGPVYEEAARVQLNVSQVLYGNHVRTDENSVVTKEVKQDPEVNPNDLYAITDKQGRDASKGNSELEIVDNILYGQVSYRRHHITRKLAIERA